jgi:hypothetical protein
VSKKSVLEYLLLHCDQRCELWVKRWEDNGVLGGSLGCFLFGYYFIARFARVSYSGLCSELCRRHGISDQYSKSYKIKKIKNISLLRLVNASGTVFYKQYDP